MEAFNMASVVPQGWHLGGKLAAAARPKLGK
jgi:hypothetical protein